MNSNTIIEGTAEELLLLQSSVFKLKTKVCYVFPILYKHSENYGNIRLYFQFRINLPLCGHPTWKYKLVGFRSVLYIWQKFFLFLFLSHEIWRPHFILSWCVHTLGGVHWEERRT